MRFNCAIINHIACVIFTALICITLDAFTISKDKKNTALAAPAFLRALSLINMRGVRP